MEQQLLQFIAQKNLFTKEDKLLLAVSGGLDSMVMLHIFHRLNFDITVAHCNFNLRGKESDADADLVENNCQSLKTPCFITSFDTTGFAEANKLSIQMAARKLRYNWFEELTQNHGYTRICTAHHSDDQTETILLNLIRGKGARGATGIPVKNGKIVRPLLAFSKNVLLQYAISNHLHWREDSSNLKEDYQRNLIRLQVIPILQKINPSLTDTLQHFGEMMDETVFLAEKNIEVFLDLHCESSPEGRQLHLYDLNLHPAKKSILFYFLSPFGFQSGQMEMIARNLSNQPGKVFYSATHRAVLDRDRLIISTMNEVTNYKKELIDIHQEHYFFKDGELTLQLITPDKISVLQNKNPNIAFIDMALINNPLVIRNWEKGDSFYPLGMDHQRKLSDYFIDRKISVVKKEKIRLLVNGNDIIWIIGERIDQRYRITENTKNVLALTWKPNEQ